MRNPKMRMGRCEREKSEARTGYEEQVSARVVDKIELRLVLHI
jgi:hypothetical protein